MLGSNENNAKDSGKKIQDSVNLPSLSPNNDNDDNPLTPEDIDKYNKNIKEQYKEQIENTQSSTETPLNPSEPAEPNKTPSNLRGWRKIIYCLGKLTELFDNI